MVTTVLKYLLETPYPSFKIKNLRDYFTTSYIIKGFFIAFCLSLFIYLDYLAKIDLDILKAINSIVALIGFYLLLLSKREILFWSGAFVGILWFWWMAMSFRYYEVIYLVPFMILFLALGYGLIFWVVGLFTPIIRAILFAFIGYLNPLNFNWFVPQISLLDSYFGISDLKFLTLLVSIAIFITIKERWRYVALFGAILAINLTPHKPSPLSKQRIFLSDLKTPQNLKWEDSYKDESLKINFNIIQKAIDDRYNIVVLSESAFAMFLNQEPYIVEELKKLSKKIAIVTGGLYFDGKDPYNSTYYFINGKMRVANKVVLVPFGEEIPLPKFISKTINKIIYNGAEDYISASKPTDININGELFRNAVCYEATREELFVGNPKFMIAISNNSWFIPSIEPTQQRLLLRYFSRKYHTTIYHSANMGISGIIRE